MSKTENGKTSLKKKMTEFMAKIVAKEFRLNEMEADGFFQYEAVVEGSRLAGGKVRVVLAVGPNGSGKSLLGRMMESVIRNEGAAFRMVSMKNRTSGLMGQRFVFGSEDDGATGLNTVAAVELLLNNMTKESDTGGGGGLDEPTLGLSAEYSLGVGAEVARVLATAPKHFLFVSSHDRLFVRGLIEGLQAAGIGWAFVEFGGSTENKGAAAWMDKEIEHKPWSDLSKRKKHAHTMWQKVQAVLTAKNKAK